MPGLNLPLVLSGLTHYLVHNTGLPREIHLPLDHHPTTTNTSPIQLTRGEECTRRCDGVPKICYFQFIIERYTTLGGACRNCTNGVFEDCFLPQCVTANAFEKPIITVNRKVPGPSLQICKGDRLVVDVVNQMSDATTTIHWHGINHNGSQYYDGVPFVTQCPILPGTIFRYDFLVRRPGSYFYHSHVGVQKLDGVSGALIVREIEKENLLGSLYDEDLPEHVIMIQDWINKPAEQLIPIFSNGNIPQGPDAYLINGRTLHYSKNSSVRLPLSEFRIEKGKRYRFRLIGSTCLTCAVSIKFQGHRLLAISADGELRFKPVPVDTIVLNAGERFDVILEANQTECLYLIHLQSLGRNCNPQPHIALLVYKSVVYRYEDIKLPKPLSYEELGVILNAVTTTCDGKNCNEICISQLEGVEDAIKHSYSETPYHQFDVTFGFYQYKDDDLFRNATYQHYLQPLNDRRIKSLVAGISFKPPSSPLLSQYDDIPKNYFCEEECYKTTVKKPCSCTNLYYISLGAIVDLIIYDSGFINGLNHPFHLHGYNFYVLEIGVFTNNEHKRMELDSLRKKLKEDNLNLKSRPMKDTITIPSGGYCLVRFIASNPGFWSFHCHYAFHLESGMAAVLIVGKKHDLPGIPYKFPKCGNF